MRRLFSNNKGFTLLEAILSLATLALLSGFILQMFIVAASANDRAQNIDKASAEAAALIEFVKALEASDGLQEIFTASKDAHYQCYDAAWRALSGETDPARLPAEAVFLLSASVAEEQTGAGVMAAVRVAVTDLKADGDRQTLVEYEAAKYFSE
ncbi:MAG: prepilin-type N-terminal cleavage/methylation domain-containing protein [Clostridiales bacterium]|jgi:hypothetical protein|nr:prepilin-type N-terminal cleavage/methylation domain-containing protein [Clostridiales bacterium]